MRWASAASRGLVDARHADRDTPATCPVCGDMLRLRRGVVRAAHWAHIPPSSCPWSAPSRGRRGGQDPLFPVDDMAVSPAQRRAAGGHRGPVDGQLALPFDDTSGVVEAEPSATAVPSGVSVPSAAVNAVASPGGRLRSVWRRAWRRLLG